MSSVVDRRQNTPAKKASALSNLATHWRQRITGGGRRYSFRRRRLVASVCVLLALTATSAIATQIDTALLHRGVMTGWTLMGCLVLLMLIGVRRRIPILPLGTMSTWTQVHIYTGLFALGMFLLHVPALLSGRLIPSGYFEATLAILFWAVSGSGIYGLIASRRLPIQLTNVGEQIRFDQIAWRRQQIAESAQAELETLTSPASIRVLGEFDALYLKRYLTRSPSWWYMLMPTSSRRRRMMAGLQELNRYLDDEGQSTTGKLSGLVRMRDDLDYQYALQFRLRAWVIGHATASVALIVMALAHGLLAMRFVES
ncbi:hypothetical protein [Neorhodopirellula lusitana]|uniref:hypothetical protein n=1 Tax=Neorhodopirellula lusitana TaxID=445327 RepID=UPI00384F274A